MKFIFTLPLLILCSTFALAQQELPNDGITSPLHKKYMGKMVFANSVLPLKFNGENESGFLTKFKLGDPIFYRIYMDNSLFNYANKLSPGQKREDINSKGGYKIKFYLDNTEVYFADACEGTSGFLAKEQEAMTTFKGALNNPKEKAIGEIAFNEFVAKAIEKLTIGDHLIKVEMYPTVSFPKMTVGSVVATGEFTLTIASDSFIPYDPANCLPKAQMADKVVEENILKAFKAQGWQERPAIVRIVDANWTIVRHEVSGVIIKRTIDAIVASTNGYKCQYQVFGFSQNYDGTKFQPEIFLDNIGDPKQISCKCIK